MQLIFRTHFKEEHYVLAIQPHSEYLVYLTLQRGNAAAISEAIFEFTGKCYINDELKVIGCDLLNVNAGCMKGDEEKRGHRVMCLICLLHTNELPLRHLFTNLDKKACEKISFWVRIELLALVHLFSQLIEALSACSFY